MTTAPEPALPDSSVRVVLVNYRTFDHIAALLDGPALRGQRVVLVDNASDPDRIRALATAHNARYVLLETNVGFAAGVNAGVRALPGSEPWLLLNPDVILTVEDLSRLLDGLRVSDGVAPLLVNSAGGLQVGAAGGPVSLTSVATYFLFFAQLLPWLHGIFFTRRQLRKGGRCAWLCMACMVLRPDAFERFGPLPEDEIVYAEDVAWGTNATQAGAVLTLAADVAVHHEQGASGGSALWSDSVARLCHRRLGRVRGKAATQIMRLGLALRRHLRALAQS